jgi:hypothetical protein
MNQLLPREVVDQIMREDQRFAAAPQAFFEAWKRGVEIAGPEWFGDGTREGLNQANTKWDLRPDMLRLNDALGVLSSGERMFLSAMVSFYNAAMSLRAGSTRSARSSREGLATVLSIPPVRDMRPQGHVPQFLPHRPAPTALGDSLRMPSSEHQVRPDMLGSTMPSAPEQRRTHVPWSGAAMLKRCHFHGLSDFDGLDLERRKVIADLLVNYNGW